VLMVMWWVLKLLLVMDAFNSSFRTRVGHFVYRDCFFWFGLQFFASKHRHVMNTFRTLKWVRAMPAKHQTSRTHQQGTYQNTHPHNSNREMTTDWESLSATFSSNLSSLPHDRFPMNDILLHTPTIRPVY